MTRSLNLELKLFTENKVMLINIVERYSNFMIGMTNQTSVRELAYNRVLSFGTKRSKFKFSISNTNFKISIVEKKKVQSNKI